jgi:hypothetical protein
MRIEWKPGEAVVLADNRTAVPASFKAIGIEPFEDRPELTVDLDIEVDRWGRARCTRLEMSAEPGGSLNWEPCRKLPLDQLVRYAREGASGLLAFDGETNPGVSRFAFLGTDESRATIQEQGSRRNRTVLNDEFLSHVAACYREALASEDGAEKKAPTRYVAQEMAGGWETGYSAAKRWVSLARSAGFLGRTVRGRKAA